MDTGLIFLGAAAYLMMGESSSSEEKIVQKAYYFIQGKGYVAEGDLSNYDYFYFAPAGGYVPQSQIIEFLAAGGTQDSTPPTEGSTGGGGPSTQDWIDLGESILDIILTGYDIFGEDEEDDSPSSGGSTDWDGVFARGKKTWTKYKI